MFFGRTGAKAETPVLWPPHAKSWLIGKDSDAGRDLGAGGEGDDRGWDGWMASPTRWMWVWVNSGSWWWTGRPRVLQFMGSQTVRHDWVTEVNWSPYIYKLFFSIFLSFLPASLPPFLPIYLLTYGYGFQQQDVWCIIFVCFVHYCFLNV